MIDASSNNSFFTFEEVAQSDILPLNHVYPESRLFAINKTGASKSCQFKNIPIETCKFTDDLKIFRIYVLDFMDFNSCPSLDCKIGLAVRLVQLALFRTTKVETGTGLCFLSPSDNTEHLNVERLTIPMSANEAAAKSPEDLWSHVAKQLNIIFKDHCTKTKFLCFFAPFTHKGRSPKPVHLASGSLALFAFPNYRIWPTKLAQISETLSNVDCIHDSEDFSANRHTVWANYSTSLGTILHEIGHCLDLDHSHAGIMRRGGDDINLVLAFPVSGERCKNGCSVNAKGIPGISDWLTPRFVPLEQGPLHQINPNADPYNLWAVCYSAYHFGSCLWGRYNTDILAKHPWLYDFNHVSHSRQTLAAGFRFEGHILSSVLPLHVVQVRLQESTISNGNLTCSSNSVDPFVVWHQCFPDDQVVRQVNLKPLLPLPFLPCKVIVMDKIGTLLKRTLHQLNDLQS
ncbi:hypothetical protein Ciccas_003683 [Cichlidogyrus casuarinus]|uniref:Zinc metalloproteinase n=1 Tax=Cichlidogyrus casuarinus TaxID=1844966 RepID=A0ABD2QEK2_9PLAT